MKLFDTYFMESPEGVTLFSDLESPMLDERYRPLIHRMAEEALAYEIPQIPASFYLEFQRIGDRSHFDGLYHERRDKLFALLLGSLYEGCDRYLDKMIDLVWAISEETSWVISAHNVSRDFSLLKKGLPDAFDIVPYVDLFAATTGALFALVYHYCKEELAERTDGILPERIEYEVKRRILTPFLTLKMRWAERNNPNNWVSWICSNVLTCGAVFLSDDKEKREKLLSLCAEYIDRLLTIYGEDCACNEGASYWLAAVGTIYDAAELIFDMTKGDVSLFDTPFLQKACPFGPALCVDADSRTYVNFADCGVHNSFSGSYLYRMGERLRNESIRSFGSALYFGETEGEARSFINAHFPYRAIKSLLEAPAEKLAYKPLPDAVYPDLGLCVIRRGAFTLAAKGGHNGESHNHNDVGHFVLYHKGVPILIDTGNETYNKETFGPNRYSIWVNRSDYHNLPMPMGMTQSAGREYRADYFTCENGVCETEFSSAYPMDVKCTRKMTVTEERVTVATFVSTEATHVFMTAICPVIAGNTVTVGQVKMHFSEKVGITLEEIPLADPQLRRGWRQDRLYRLLVTAGELTVTFTEV